MRVIRVRDAADARLGEVGIRHRLLIGRHASDSVILWEFGRLAQLVERLLYTQVVAGSSPAPPIAQPRSESGSRSSSNSKEATATAALWVPLVPICAQSTRASMRVPASRQCAPDVITDTVFAAVAVRPQAQVRKSVAKRGIPSSALISPVQVTPAGREHAIFPIGPGVRDCGALPQGAQRLTPRPGRLPARPSEGCNVHPELRCSESKRGTTRGENAAAELSAVFGQRRRTPPCDAGDHSR